MGYALPASVPTAPARPRLRPVPAPADPRPGHGLGRRATVHVLHAPVDRGGAAPLRLTRRGIVVLTGLVLVLGAVIVWIAAMSAPGPAATGTDVRPAIVTVRAGDTLWSIAQRVAPNADPRAEVAVLQRANGLAGVLLRPGQRIRVP